MDLPKNSQKLISEYSKPITKPDWKCGTKHAYIFKSCPALHALKDNFIINYYDWVYEEIYGKDAMYKLYLKPFNEILQELGNEIFGMYTCYFYNYLRDNSYLKNTYKR